MTKEKSGMVNTVPVDNRPVSSAVLPQPYHPIYDDEDAEIGRTNVLLKNGTTVAYDDYNEDVHGPSVEETDEEYRQRMRQRPAGRPNGPMHPRTTIAALHTFDPSEVPVADAVNTVAPVAVGAVGMPVATLDEVNPNLINPVGSEAVAEKSRAPKRVITAPKSKSDDK